MDGNLMATSKVQIDPMGLNEHILKSEAARRMVPFTNAT